MFFHLSKCHISRSMWPRNGIKADIYSSTVQQTCRKLLCPKNKRITGDTKSLRSYKKLRNLPAAHIRQAYIQDIKDEKLDSSCRSSVWLVNSNTPSSPTVGSHQFNGNKPQTQHFSISAHTRKDTFSLNLSPQEVSFYLHSTTEGCSLRDDCLTRIGTTWLNYRLSCD